MNHPNSTAHYSRGLMWFRRDLRASDNAALHHALKTCNEVYVVFVFDTDILGKLPRYDRRVEFIRESLVELNKDVRLIVKHGVAHDELLKLAKALQVQAVFANHDDEPAALVRDAKVAASLASLGMQLHTFKDHVVFERQEVLTQTGKPYTVFTPYKNAWLKKLAGEEGAFYLKPYAIEKYKSTLLPPAAEHGLGIPSLADLGFEKSNLSELKLPVGSRGAQKLLADFVMRMGRYKDARDFPAVKGPSYLSVHLRFGTVSIRQLAAIAYQTLLHGAAADREGAQTWLSELIWRDFYVQIMSNFSHSMAGAFKPEYDRIQWESGDVAQELFAAWCEARTGYPLVDAAMRQLNQTGYMHNRLRMVVASFLTKDLGIDWRWGEAYFATHLIDFDLSANNGGWQWAASSGCDAQPYFRIFNPITQNEKFDAQGKFIRRYMPELAHLSDKEIHLPRNPIVDHAEARAKTLARYAVVKN